MANELVGNRVHPEIPHLLSRMNMLDIQALLLLLDKTQNEELTQNLSSLRKSIDVHAGGMMGENSADTAAYIEQLAKLHSIKVELGEWQLSVLGKAFLLAISALIEVEEQSSSASSKNK